MARTKFTFEKRQREIARQQKQKDKAARRAEAKQSKDESEPGTQSGEPGEGDMGDSHMGLQARLMSQALRKLTGAISKSKTAVVFINQLREKIGVMFGNPETTPGGRALKFYSSVRLDMRRVETIKQGQEAIGIRARVKVVKNKVAPPFKTAEFEILFNQGISKEGNLLDVGADMAVIKKSGSYYIYGETRLGQGRENARTFLKNNPAVAQEIEAQIKSNVAAYKGPASGTAAAAAAE